LATGDSVDLDEAIAHLAPDVPRARFAWGPPRRLFETPRSQEPTMVVARRLDPQMRVDLAVRGFIAARGLDPAAMASWQLAVVGDGPDRALVESAAAGDPSVTFHGRLALAELRDLLARSRVLINVPAADATSAILLDGLAMGLLPLVNDLPAYAEWIDPSVGEVVERDPSPEALGAAIVRATTRDVDPDRIRERARPVEWESQVDVLLGAYARAGWSP
jgi:glycosyltransferase involved in cell wall biosynthesis